MQPTSDPTSLASPAASDRDLAVAAVRRLEKRPSRFASWGLLKTIVLGVPTFGLLPLVSWSGRFREFAGDDASAMQALAQWARSRGREPAAVGPILAAAEDTSFRPLPWVFALMLSVFVIGVFAIQYASQPFTIEGLLNCTYYHRFQPYSSSPLPRAEFLYRVWVAALCFGYMLHWAQIGSHANDVKRFVRRFNPVLAAHHLPPVKWPSRGWVFFRPMWWLTAIVLCCYGAWWGIPMVLAAMAQRRYTKMTGRGVRADLARRMRDVLAMQPAYARVPGAGIYGSIAAVPGSGAAPVSAAMPMPGVPGSAPLMALPLIARPKRCANPRCLAIIHPHARFCTRCGSPSDAGPEA